MNRREEMFGTYSRLLDAVPEKEADKFALGLAVRVLDVLAKDSLLTAQSCMAGALADAIRGRVPAKIAAALNPSKKGGQ